MIRRINKREDQAAARAIAVSFNPRVSVEFSRVVGEAFVRCHLCIWNTGWHI